MTRPVELTTIIVDQIRWSSTTFGTAFRPRGTVAHIRKELTEIEAKPRDLKEWIDVVILGLDGAWRCLACDDPGAIATPFGRRDGAPFTDDEIAGISWLMQKALVEKQAENRQRQWPPPPDNNTPDTATPIEHVRTPKHPIEIVAERQRARHKCASPECDLPDGRCCLCDQPCHADDRSSEHELCGDCTDNAVRLRLSLEAEDDLVGWHVDDTGSPRLVCSDDEEVFSSDDDAVAHVRRLLSAIRNGSKQRDLDEQADAALLAAMRVDMTAARGEARAADVEVDRRTDLMRAIGRRLGIDHEGYMSVDVLAATILGNIAAIEAAVDMMQAATGKE